MKNPPFGGLSRSSFSCEWKHKNKLAEPLNQYLALFLGSFNVSVGRIISKWHPRSHKVKI